MPKPLSDFYSFPVYQRREDIAGTVPPYDPNKPIKTWIDPSPSNVYEDDLLGSVVNYAPTLKFVNGRPSGAGPDGVIKLGSLRLTVDDAQQFNLAPSGGKFPLVGEAGVTAANLKNQSISVPVPLTLPAGARVVEDAFAGAIVYLAGETIPDRTKPNATGGSFTDADRTTLNLIAAQVAGIAKLVQQVLDFFAKGASK